MLNKSPTIRCFSLSIKILNNEHCFHHPSSLFSYSLKSNLYNLQLGEKIYFIISIQHKRQPTSNRHKPRTKLTRPQRSTLYHASTKLQLHPNCNLLIYPLSLTPGRHEPQLHHISNVNFNTMWHLRWVYKNINLLTSSSSAKLFPIPNSWYQLLGIWTSSSWRNGNSKWAK